MAGKTLTEELFQNKRLDIVSHFLDNPEGKFTLKEVEENSGASYKTVKETVDLLEEYGFLETERKGHYRMVELNQDSPYVEVFRQLGELDSKPLRDTAGNFASELEDRYPEAIETVVLYGSVARGVPTSESDIDLLVLVKDSEDREQVNDEAWSLADSYEREEAVDFSPLVQSVEEFGREARNGAPLENRIIEEGKILVGELPSVPQRD